MDISEKQQEALLKYEDLKLQIKELEVQLDPLKEIIMPLMEKGKDLQCEKGVIKLKERANWTFSADVKTELKKVEEMKADEIAKGIAQNKPTIYIEYSVAKKGEDAGE